MYPDFEQVIHDPFRATHVNDALILCDPTGFLTEMQNKVRAVFMKPKWLDIRVQFWLVRAQKAAGALRDVVRADEHECR